MTKIIRYENYCKISEEDDVEIFRKLDYHLSYEIPGAEYSKAFKGYTNEHGEFVAWDGRRHIMSSTGRFPPGLFTRVLEFYDKMGVSPIIVDGREEKLPGTPIEILPTLIELNKKPRTYQEEAAEIACAHDRGIIRIATGGGKSLVAALIAAKLGKPTIIYVIGQDLLYQFHDFFTDVFGTEIGIIGDGKCEIKDINIATIWSVGQALGLKKNASLDDEGSTEKKTDPAKFSTIKRMLLNTSVHIMDECHLAACDTVQIISRNIKAEYVYGMSASPWRDDNADLLIEAFLGKKIIDLSAKKLIEQGFLVEPDIRFLAPPLYKKKSKYQTLYQTYVVENEIRNGMIAKGAVKLIEQGFPTLVLFHSIKHGDILNSIIAPQVPTGLLSGKDGKKERERIKNDLEGGKIKCIIASKIFDIGIDLPILSGLIVAGAGKSSVRALQRIGRVIRPYAGKSRAAIIDFADQARYLDEHAEKRRDIYSQEFNKIKWPHEKSKKVS